MRARSIPSARRSLVLALVALVGLARPAAAQSPTAAGLLEVRVYEAGSKGAVDRRAVRDATLSLLAASGVMLAWRDCGPADSCAQEGPRAGVTVILTPAARDHCGTTALEPGLASATVLVSLPCVSAVVDALSRGGRNRQDPRLASLRMEHVLAAAIAHELGHAMGLGHADRGLMRARLGVDEILDLRQGLLAYTHSRPPACGRRACGPTPSSPPGAEPARRASQRHPSCGATCVSTLSITCAL